MKYNIDEPTGSGLRINHVHIIEIAPKTLHIIIDSDYKWPIFVYGACGNIEEITLITDGIGDVGEELHAQTVRFFPEKEWENDIILARYSNRYGWSGFAVAMDLLD